MLEAEEPGVRKSGVSYPVDVDKDWKARFELSERRSWPQWILLLIFPLIPIPFVSLWLQLVIGVAIVAIALAIAKKKSQIQSSESWSGDHGHG